MPLAVSRNSAAGDRMRCAKPQAGDKMIACRTTSLSPANSRNHRCVACWRNWRRASVSSTRSPCCRSRSSRSPRRRGSPVISRPTAPIDRVYCPACAMAISNALAIARGNLPIERGPADLRDLPDYFRTPPTRADYGAYDIAILAEINHAPRLSPDELLTPAPRQRADGADIIDLGCDSRARPGTASATPCGGCATMRACACRSTASIPGEVGGRGAGRAELVLSVNSESRARLRPGAARSSPCPMCRRPCEGLDGDHRVAARASVLRFASIPVLEPIAFGFAASLGRYLEVRRRYPDAEMLMGVGNLTELTDVDSGGHQRVARGFLPGSRHPQRADHGGHQLGAEQRARVRPGAPAGVPRLQASRAAEASRAEPDAAARSEAAPHGDECCAIWRSSCRIATFASSPSVGDCTSSIAICGCKGPIRSTCSRRWQACRHRSGACVLPWLRNGEGDDGVDAGKELHPGSGVAMGLLDGARKEHP